MRTVFRIFVFLCVITVAGLGLYMAYQYGVASKASVEVGRSSGTDEAPLVYIRPVEAGTLEKWVSVTGTIEPDVSAEIYPEVAGELENFSLADGTPIEEGLVVEKGQVIGVIEYEDLKAAVDEAEANLQVARASLSEVKANLDYAGREKERMVALYRDGTASEKQRDKAVTSYEATIARLHLAEDRVKQARAALRRARLKYQDATVKAPISGIINRTHVDQGTYVSPARPLLEIINIEHVEIKGGVTERYLPMLCPGKTKAQVELDAYPGETFTGTIDRVQPGLDTITRTARVTIRLKNPELKLKPGMFARIKVIVARKTDIPVIPDKAIVGEEGDYRVYVVREGKANLQPLRIGLQQGDRNEVLEGPGKGEWVVVSGHHLLKDGLSVKTRKETASR